MPPISGKTFDRPKAGSDFRPLVSRHAPFAVRGAFCTSTGDPFASGIADTRRYERDGMVVIENGYIAAAGPAEQIATQLPAGCPVEQLPASALLVPGFVDCHVHYAQLGVIASHGEQLLEWLERYTFAAEQALDDGIQARAAARQFFDLTLASGTTTTAVFCTVHPGSVDAYFAEAQARGVRTIAGKVLMDRNAPASLCDSAQRGYDASKTLIGRWHGQGRLGYAITPRFAPTSTPAQLEAAGTLWREHPDCWVQSHLAEHRREVAWVRGLFPQARDYVDVYARAGLLGRRAIYGHGIHLGERELATLAESGTAIAHCPTSNLFLGSGRFDLRRVKRPLRPVHVGLGTDVGAGTSLSMLRTIAAAHDIARMGGATLGPGHAFHLATRGGAEALGIEDQVGSIAGGMEADLVVLDLEATPLLAQRTRRARDLDEVLFALFILGDERAVARTLVAGVDANAQRGRE